MQKEWTFTTGYQLPVKIQRELEEVAASLAGKRVTLKLGESKRYSSQSQREYYFAVIVPAWQKLLHQATDKHWDKDKAHDYLMREIGQWFEEGAMVFGNPYAPRRSYMDLSVEECERHHTLCRARAAEEHIQIPEPNEIPIDAYEVRP